MVVPSNNINGCEKMMRRLPNGGVPIIDLSLKRSLVQEQIVKASEEYGFFKVINHGVSKDTIANMEREGLDFFAKSSLEKQRAGPPTPLGYGIKNIGLNGDMGEVEYLILHTNPQFISQSSQSISDDPTKFREVEEMFGAEEETTDVDCEVLTKYSKANADLTRHFAVNDYIQAVRGLACEILDLMAEALWVHPTSYFSDLIKHLESDSLIRLNYYPAGGASTCKKDITTTSMDSSAPPPLHHYHKNNKIGFGEHSDPQILTILRSNDVGGLQISLDNGVWMPVPPDPTSFCVNVGDILQVLTNGRFISARHRVLTNSLKSRMSMIYFGAPPLHAWISPLPELILPHTPCLYRPFTWAEFKKTAYSLRLGDDRLNIFQKYLEDNNNMTP